MLHDFGYFSKIFVKFRESSFDFWEKPSYEKGSPQNGIQKSFTVAAELEVAA